MVIPIINPANNVNQGDDDPGNGIPFDEFHRTIHRTIQLAFLLDRQAVFRVLGWNPKSLRAYRRRYSFAYRA